MAYAIAVSGKGGTGKSTIAALILKAITRDFGRTVLAVDADANFSLGLMLGVEVGKTVADILEDLLKGNIGTSPGVPKGRVLEYHINQLLVEAERFDLLTMGRPEGPNCYCYVNMLLRQLLDTISKDYPFVIIDNEAGMEHLSRRTTSNVDLLVVVSEPTVVSIRSASRICELVRKLPVAVKKTIVILNRAVEGKISHEIARYAEEAGIEISHAVPFEEELLRRSASGDTVLATPENSAAYGSVKRLLAQFVAEPVVKRQS